eukprot:353706-Chlamydomonas_euryale.AAC.2
MPVPVLCCASCSAALLCCHVCQWTSVRCSPVQRPPAPPPPPAVQWPPVQCLVAHAPDRGLWLGPCACRVEVAFDSQLWPDTTRLPCRESEYELGVPACDYVLTGWQTAPGDPYTLLLPTPSNPDIAQCCPEGVVQFCDAAITGACNPRLSDSSWRLSFNRNATDGTYTTVFFNLETVPVLSPVVGGCDATSVDTIRLGIDPSVTLTFVLIDGLSAPFSQPAPGVVDITANVPAGRASYMMLTFSGTVGASDICSNNLGSYMVCSYQIFSSGGTCCALADVPVEVMNIAVFA